MWSSYNILTKTRLTKTSTTFCVFLLFWKSINEGLQQMVIIPLTCFDMWQNNLTKVWFCFPCFVNIIQPSLVDGVCIVFNGSLWHYMLTFTFLSFRYVYFLQQCCSVPIFVLRFLEIICQCSQCYDVFFFLSVDNLSTTGVPFFSFVCGISGHVDSSVLFKI